MSKLISIIVPVYNVEKYLEKCIQSLVNQSYKNIEIILIDDGSTDGSGTICNTLAHKDRRIIVKHIDNSGVSNARNVGLNISKGDYIGFVDPDDFIVSEMYEKMMDKIKENNYDIVCCNNYYGTTDNYKINIPLKKDLNMNDLEYQEFCLKYGGQVWNRLYKRSLIKKIRFSSEIFVLEDLLFNLEISNQQLQAYYINEPYYYYYINMNGALRRKTSKNIISSFYAQEEIIKIVEKNKLSCLNTLKLNYIFFVKFNQKYISDNQNLSQRFDSIAKEYIKDKVFIKKAPIFLKLKTFFIYYNPKLYFFIKKVINHAYK